MHLETEIASGNIRAIIARSADLYGPYATVTSVPYILTISNLMKGRKAQWMANVNKIHSFTYTIDCAKGMILLSNSDNCFNQTWHLPTFNPPLDGKTFIEHVARELGVAPDYTVLKKWMVRMLSFFNKTVYESYEMLYQSEFDYYFDSTKFNDFFNYKPLPYPEGIHDTLEFLKMKKVF
jgi:nucleoside-diphosphate-sugar epimerase